MDFYKTKIPEFKYNKLGIYDAVLDIFEGYREKDPNFKSLIPVYRSKIQSALPKFLGTLGTNFDIKITHNTLAKNEYYEYKNQGGDFVGIHYFNYKPEIHAKTVYFDPESNKRFCIPVKEDEMIILPGNIQYSVVNKFLVDSDDYHHKCRTTINTQIYVR